ncbi:EAL domain-containing protein [Zavarzinia sp. CC-PAN008]|uniref:EAL domain-containing protein n=1 Tax=Zavarzinia sp. CC-PAN008 TaxID=3243332 RepID=UPI003F748498
MAPATGRLEGLADADLSLADQLERLTATRKERVGVLIHVSRLQPHNRREHHLRIMLNAFDRLIKRAEGMAYQFRNNDLLLLFRGAKVEEVDELVLRLRFLFSNDPLIGGEDGEGAFATVYDLAGGGFQDLFGVAVRRQQALARARPDKPADPTQKVVQTSPIDPSRLARMENALSGVDLTPLLRRQAICAYPAGIPPTPIFTEIYVSIPGLQKALMPDTELTADRWLFQRLTERIDQRVLSVLPRIEGEGEASFSININVSTLLSPAFMAFDKALRQRTQKSVVLEVQSADVFSDMGAFVFVREYLRDRGYRMCLDGLNHLTFPLIDRAKLRLDLQKVHWHPELAAEKRAERRAEFADAVQRAGVNRVILCRCDDETAIEWGRSLGLRFFQGRYIDQVMGRKPV